MKKLSKSDKLNAAEVAMSLMANWDKVRQVILFSSPVLRFKATRRKGQNEILITFGRPNYAERILYKKAKKNKDFKLPAMFSLLLKKGKK